MSGIVFPSMALYNDITDVMYFRLGESRFTSEEEVMPGVHVLYEYDNGRKNSVIGVEIEYFKERFGNETALDIPAAMPFTLSLVGHKPNPCI